MKTKFLLIIFALVAFTFMMPQNALSQKKYYVIYDNFEDQMTMDGSKTITNLFDLCYWDHLKNDVLLGQYFERKPFNSASMVQKDITEYDVAVFVLGRQNHLASSVDGIKVLDKIKQMLAANKSVVIIGHAVIPAAFMQGGDADSKAWLMNYMGIANPLQMDLVHGGTIYGFRVDGVEGDPVSAGYKKQCNRIFKENTSEEYPPIRWYPQAFACQLKENAKSVAFDYVKELMGDSALKDIIITGVRNEDNKARCILYTVNFDIASGAHLNHFYNSLSRGIRWAVRDVPHPEGFLTAEDETLDFDKIEPNQKGYQTAVLMNTGREKVTISSIEIAGDEPEGSFVINEGGGSVTLNPGEVHQVSVMFAPKEGREYEDFLIINSDAYNGDIEIQLIGVGGEQVFNGPKLSITTLPVDFGTVPFGLFSDKNISISNTGNVSLIVESVTLALDADKRFTYTEVVKMPMTIPPGKSNTVKVRFISQDEDAGDFTGRIDIVSNGLNNSGLGLGKGSIELKARAAGKSTESGISLSSTSLDFGEVELGSNSINTLKISNIGGNNLRVFNVTWDSKSGGENLAQFEFVDNSHKNIPILAPGESHDLKIKFEPQSDKDYAARFILTTNDPINEGLVEVPVAGKGKDISSVREGIASIEGLTVKINPNPVVSYATISYTLEMPGNISIDVIDASGRKIEHITNGFLTNGEFNRDFNTDNIANGMYFISVDFNGQKLQIPFIVTK